MKKANKTEKVVPHATVTNAKSTSWTDEERSAMRARAQEFAVEARAGKKRADGEAGVLATIAKMSTPDRMLAKQLHTLVKVAAPALSPKTWYGMPAYTSNDKIVCFFQSAEKFKTRYATFGFQQEAKLDDGTMWPVAFALKKLTSADEAKIVALVKQAVMS